jgi:hypothetical protein
MKQRVVLLWFFLSMQLFADQFSFYFYNDFFARTDKHFTNGGSLAWIDDSFSATNDPYITTYSKLAYEIMNALPFTNFSIAEEYTAGMSLSQYMFTPEDINVTHPQYDDIPYMGHLTLDFFLFEIYKDSFNEFRLSVGTIGKASGAEQVQKTIHKWTGSDEPQGWDTQLGPLVTFNILYRHGAILWEKGKQDSWRSDLFYNVGFQAGNFIIDGFGGMMIRFGYNYRKNLNIVYPYMKEDGSMLALETRNHGLGVSFTTGFNATALGYSYAEEEAIDRGYMIEQNRFQATLYAGVSFFLERHKIKVFIQNQTPYLKNYNDAERFGGFSYSYQF